MPNTLADIEEVLGRARRLYSGVCQFKGEGATWEYTFPDGIVERYTVADVMPIERLRDDVESLFVWLWITKDRLKLAASARGRDPQLIENLVNRTPALCLLADVATKLKHGEVTRNPRTPYDPTLGTPAFRIRQHGIREIVATTEGLTIKPTDSTAVEVTYPLLDSAGNVVGDAIVLLQAAIGYWEKALSQF
jgi:hypothetical protein